MHSKIAVIALIPFLAHASPIREFIRDSPLPFTCNPPKVTAPGTPTPPKMTVPQVQSDCLAAVQAAIKGSMKPTTGSGSVGGGATGPSNNCGVSYNNFSTQNSGDDYNTAVNEFTLDLTNDVAALVPQMLASKDCAYNGGTATISHTLEDGVSFDVVFKVAQAVSS